MLRPHIFYAALSVSVMFLGGLFLVPASANAATAQFCFTSPGATNFTVPSSYTSITATVRGGGAGGVGSSGGCGWSGGDDGGIECSYSPGGTGSPGGQSRFNSATPVIANGGGVGYGQNTGGAGGTASGGNTNTSGGNGGGQNALGWAYSGPGGNGGGPGGGAGGVTHHGGTSDRNGNPGAAPGGGGSGAYALTGKSAGGGGGAYSLKTWTAGAAGAPAAGSTIGITVGGGGAGGYGSERSGGAGGAGRVDVTVNSATALQTVRITAAPAAAMSPTSITFTVTRTLPECAATTINISLGGTGVNGTHYTVSGLSGSTLTIPANQTSATFTITPVASLSALKTVTVTVASGSNYAIGSPGVASVQLVPLPTISVEPVLSGYPTTVSWSAPGASSCIVSGPNLSASGTVGSQETSAAATNGAVYTLTCQTPAGQKSVQATAQVSGSFWSYMNVYEHSDGYPTSGNSPYCYAYNLSEAYRNYPNYPNCNTPNFSGSVYGATGIFGAHKAGGSLKGVALSQYASGAPVTVPKSTSVQIEEGDGVTLEWACQVRKQIEWTECSWYGCSNTYENHATYNYASSISSSPSSFAGSNMRGATTLYPADDTTYTLQCGGYPSMSINVLVGPPEAPLATITASSTSITRNQSTNILATFTPSFGDSLTYTAINGPAPTPVPGGYEWTLANGLSWTPPTNKTYTFSPSALDLDVGTYRFIPSMQTSLYPPWNDYGAYVDITVTCPTGSSGADCSICDEGSGYYSDGFGGCVLDICTDIAGNQATVPEGCNTPSPSPGICLPSGQTECVAIPSEVELQATPPRVRTGNSTTITWTGSNFPTTPGACSISTSPAIDGFPQTVTSGANGSLSGVEVGPITARTVVTLTCTSPVGEVTVGTIPVYREI